MEERRLPFWARPFFAAGTTLPADRLRTLVLVSLALFFENYDIGLVNAARPQIAEGLAISGQDTGFMLSAIRLGGLGAFLLIPFAHVFAALAILSHIAGVLVQRWLFFAEAKHVVSLYYGH